MRRKTRLTRKYDLFMKSCLPYQLLDSGDCRKLEQVGPHRVIRPALNAFWKPTLPDDEWKKADAVFERESTGGGTWTWRKGVSQPPEGQWRVAWGGVNLTIKPTHFGHLGFFAEQAPNWAWLRECAAPCSGKRPTALNLFAYSGGASIAMAQAGADVCHLDASKGILEWTRKNQELNPGTENVRRICDDAMKFLVREHRRGHTFDGLVLDPPSFGRGAQGQVWKIETGLEELLSACRDVLSLRPGSFLLLSCHSQGFSPVSLARSLTAVFPEAADGVEFGEMLIPESTGRVLPAGIFARFRLPLKKGAASS